MCQNHYLHYNKKSICIVDDGYMWLQQFPLDKKHSVTTMFDANGEIVQWYIDICLCNGIENDRPWMDDLFLDIVFLPSGEIVVKDADELEEALVNGRINKHLYNLAWDELNKLKILISENRFELIKLSKVHQNILFNNLK